MTLHIRLHHTAMLALLLVCLFLPVAAQTWPERPIRLIAATTPGGVNDTVARLIAEPLSEALKQSVVVDNKPGAGGLLGTEIAARATADGYTFSIFTDANTIFPSTQKNLKHSPLTSFAHISVLGRGSHVLIVHSSVPANNLRELIAWVQQQPKGVSAAVPSYGGPQHLALETIKQKMQADITAIPYKGGGQAVNDLIGGQVRIGLLGIAPALPHIRSGRLKAIATTGAVRSSALPEVPTVAEAGLPGYATYQWQGIVAPTGTPKAVIDRMHTEVVRILQQPDIVKKLEAIGMTNFTSASPEAFTVMVREEMTHWAQVVKAAGISAE